MLRSLTESLLYVTVNGELTSGKRSHPVAKDQYTDHARMKHYWKYLHEETSSDAGKATSEPQFLSNLDQPADSPLSRQAFGLVDLAEHGIGWL